MVHIAARASDGLNVRIARAHEDGGSHVVAEEPMEEESTNNNNNNQDQVAKKTIQERPSWWRRWWRYLLEGIRETRRGEPIPQESQFMIPFWGESDH